jgi:hypothetical protein
MLRPLHLLPSIAFSTAIDLVNPPPPLPSSIMPCHTPRLIHSLLSGLADDVSIQYPSPEQAGRVPPPCIAAPEHRVRPWPAPGVSYIRGRKRGHRRRHVVLRNRLRRRAAARLHRGLQRAACTLPPRLSGQHVRLFHASRCRRVGQSLAGQRHRRAFGGNGFIAHLHSRACRPLHRVWVQLCARIVRFSLGTSSSTPELRRRYPIAHTFNAQVTLAPRPPAAAPL